MNRLLILNICNSNIGIKLFSFLGNIFNIFKIIIPVIIIIFGIFDVLKSIMNPNEKKHIHLFTKRLIYGISIYFLSLIIIFIMSLINNNFDNECLNIFLKPSNYQNLKIDITNVENKSECDKLGKPYIWEDNKCVIDISTENVGDLK